MLRMLHKNAFFIMFGCFFKAHFFCCAAALPAIEVAFFAEGPLPAS
jgi:hypothetical protein